jgi:hypothetical protein
LLYVPVGIGLLLGIFFVLLLIFIAMTESQIKILVKIFAGVSLVAAVFGYSKMGSIGAIFTALLYVSITWAIGLQRAYKHFSRFFI